MPGATCRSCGAPITFARHIDTNRSNPMERDAAGRWVLDGSVYRLADEDTRADKRWTSHFATCPGSAQHRRSRGLSYEERRVMEAGGRPPEDHEPITTTGGTA